MRDLYSYICENGLDRLLREWDDGENAGLDIRSVTPASGKKTAWVCENGHRWRASVKSRVLCGSGCPYCSGRLPVPGVTDLVTVQPALAAEWDGEKNTLTPADVGPGSTKTVWWRCPEGHSYQAVVFSRTAGTGCPYCAGKRVLAGFNDLLTTDPALAAQWDADKNAPLTPADITRGSHARVWWRCGRGHSYQQAVFSKASGADCPYCSNRSVLAGFNDLATTDPAVAAQWYGPLNGGVTPRQITRGSARRFWWQCENGHVWRAAVFSRTRERASGCPLCAAGDPPVAPNRYIRPDAGVQRPAAGTI